MAKKRELPSGMVQRPGRDGYYSDFQVSGRRIREFLSADFKSACQILNELKSRADKSDFRFTLDEEEQLTQPEVAGRVRQTFDVDRITKRFYDRFQKEHRAFLSFIKGITAEGDREWYTSVMLNRLMFVYFVQRQGFLDNDRDYLRSRLKRLQQTRGKGHFHTFYRHFLRRLFHEGLAMPKSKRTADLDALIGSIPYLNGGIFDRHELEESNPDIDIPDQAFERVFTFFDDYHWHLDDRPLAAEDEINPDVLGYIFEQYVNRKEMGAYYTKEDITEYIARSSIIPFLLDAAATACPGAFCPGGPVWRLLGDDPDRYLFPAVRYGVDEPLPAAVAAGLDDVAKRDRWNQHATEGFGLRPEMWREHIARRRRCHALRDRMRSGAICAVNDLITCNLDLRQLAEDVIDNTTDPALLHAIWAALQKLSILDPTCGSGAFLFAALSVLEPLYDACLERMEMLVWEADQLKQFGEFTTILEKVKEHPSRQYFILKSIIVNNLYGVDVVKEATEICKLRLLLKVIAQARTVDDLEPLPDMDFNVRVGNTLVGFARLAEVQESQKDRLGFGSEEVERILAATKGADHTFRCFQALQTAEDVESDAIATTKADLRQRLHSLRAKLDAYLAADYGIDADRADLYSAWRASHQPFHWFSEFFHIMAEGGFDVIIGNPPWKEYAKVKNDYTVKGYETVKCGNLHVLCSERALQLRAPTGRMSFIVQVSLVSSSRMEIARRFLRARSADLYVIPFDDRPGKLFEGLEHCRSVIFFSHAPQADQCQSLFLSRYQRWYSDTRERVFPLIEYVRMSSPPLFADAFPKYGSEAEDDVFRRVATIGTATVQECLSRRDSLHFVFYQEATGYWIKATFGLPYYAKNGEVGAPAHGRYLYFRNADQAHAFCAVLNSSLFYAYFIAYSDCFHLSETIVSRFPVNAAILGDKRLTELNKRLMADLKKNAGTKTINTKGGDTIQYAEFFASMSKPIIDEIDYVLAEHFGFTDEQLDFIINYDIKFRLGQDSCDEEE